MTVAGKRSEMSKDLAKKELEEKALKKPESKKHEKGKETQEYPAGIKWTQQRKRVYQILQEAIEPLSAAQIYARMEAWEQEKYAISTIYRILSAFEENAIVDKTTWMGEGTVVYELKRSGHVHYAVCLDCHRRIPLEHCPLHMAGAHSPAGMSNSMKKHGHVEDALDEELETDEFTVVSHKVELYGYCKDCKQKH